MNGKKAGRPPPPKKKFFSPFFWDFSNQIFSFFTRPSFDAINSIQFFFFSCVCVCDISYVERNETRNSWNSFFFSKKKNVETRQKVNGAKILKSPTPIFCLLFIFLYLWPLIYHLSNRFHAKGARAGTSAIGFFFFF